MAPSHYDKLSTALNEMVVLVWKKNGDLRICICNDLIIISPVILFISEICGLLYFF